MLQVTKKDEVLIAVLTFACREFPLDAPDVITEQFKPIIDNVFPYRGVAKVRVLPPRSLRLSVLPLRHDGSLYFGNCRSCIEKRQEHCDHEDESQRSWIATYTTVELNLALEKNYRVLEYVPASN